MAGTWMIPLRSLTQYTFGSWGQLNAWNLNLAGPSLWNKATNWTSQVASTSFWRCPFKNIDASQQIPKKTGPGCAMRIHGTAPNAASVVEVATDQAPLVFGWHLFFQALKRCWGCSVDSCSIHLGIRMILKVNRLEQKVLESFLYWHLEARSFRAVQGAFQAMWRTSRRWVRPYTYDIPCIWVDLMTTWWYLRSFIVFSPGSKMIERSQKIQYILYI